MSADIIRKYWAMRQDKSNDASLFMALACAADHTIFSVSHLGAKTPRESGIHNGNPYVIIDDDAPNYAYLFIEFIGARASWRYPLGIVNTDVPPGEWLCLYEIFARELIDALGMRDRIERMRKIAEEQ